MNWVTIVWSMSAAVSLTLGTIHFVVWLEDRKMRANLFFALAAVAVAGIAVGEFAMMRAQTTEQIGRAQQWGHVPLFILVVAIVGFVRLYFGTGRLWLAVAACAARAVSLVINFAWPPNLNFRQITGVRRVEFLGQAVSIPEGVGSSWTHLGELGSLLVLAFVVDASVALWRQGKPESRRRAVVVGGSITAFIIIAAGIGALINAKVIHWPYLISLPFLGIVVAMGFELSRDMLHAAALSRRLQAAEAGLRESEARINLAANAANLGLWLWNIPGDELWVTEQWRKLFGFADLEPVTFDRLLQVVHPWDRERMKQLVRRMFEHGGEYESEYRIMRPDGSTRWIAGHGSVELDERGKPAFARGVSRDVTKRKIVEEELRESEARFRTVADAAPVLIWMSGVDKLCTFFNKPWLEFTGRSLEQEMGNGWAEGVHPDDLQRCHDIYVSAFDAREPFVMQYRLRRHDGEYRWISDSGVPRYDAKKNFVGYIGSCVDVTELLSKEEALREFEDRVRLAVQAAHLGVWELDTSTNQIWMSDSARALFQFDSETRVNHAVLQDRVHPEDRLLRDSAVKAAIETQGEYEIEYRILLPDGTLRWIGARGRCVAGKNGKGPRLIGVSIDITPRKAAEAEAAKRRDEISHLSRVALMGEMSASIAHELNQPLAGIATNAAAGH